MSDQAPQRAWRANCTACGAPVEFRSAASPMAVCGFCRSTLVRDGESLRRIGRSADLFDDHSPLRLGARGRHEGQPFTLIGRLQLAYPTDTGQQGRWTEWHALFDDGRSGSLAEDNGAYVMGFALASPPVPLPDFARARMGESLIMGGQPWVLTSTVQAHVHAAEGELAHVPELQQPFTVLEWRSTGAEVLSVELPPPDISGAPSLYVGRRVELPDLHLSGIADGKDVSERQVKARGIECPNCGAAVEPRMDNSRSIVCGSCHAVIDISQGLGRDLAFYRQDNTLEPLIPLGTVGRLQSGGRTDTWQVVGYQERCEVGTDADEEQVFWREYLLYNKVRGFAFLVDAEDGWSIVRPVTGVPGGDGTQVRFEGETFKRRYVYNAKTAYVLGEFYWPVARDHISLNADYRSTSGKRVLNREQAMGEITWSVGQPLPAEAVVKAFRISDDRLPAFKRDVAPTSMSPYLIVFLLAVALFVMLVVVKSCSREEPDCASTKATFGEASREYRQCLESHGRGGYRGSSGGSWGGYSSGGYHK